MSLDEFAQVLLHLLFDSDEFESKLGQVQLLHIKVLYLYFTQSMLHLVCKPKWNIVLAKICKLVKRRPSCVVL